MPFVGLIPFLREPCHEEIYRLAGVNALGWAYSISTLISIQETPTTLCVNALGRAYSISTVPLRNPSVYAGFQPCFCKQFTEYSEIELFQPVFWGFRKIYMIIILILGKIVKDYFYPGKTNIQKKETADVVVSSFIITCFLTFLFLLICTIIFYGSHK